MTAAGNGEILRWLPRVSRASVLLVVAFLAASCATEQTDSSAAPVAFATAPSPRATSAPIITRLSIPRQTDALRLKVAPDHRHVLAVGGDVATFFDLSGNTLATVDRRALGLTWVAWLPDGSGAIFANEPRAPQPLDLSVIRWGRPRVDLGRAVAPDIGGAPPSPGGGWAGVFVDRYGPALGAISAAGSRHPPHPSLAPAVPVLRGGGRARA